MNVTRNDVITTMRMGWFADPLKLLEGPCINNSYTAFLADSMMSAKDENRLICLISNGQDEFESYAVAWLLKPSETFRCPGCVKSLQKAQYQDHMMLAMPSRKQDDVSAVLGDLVVAFTITGAGDLFAMPAVSAMLRKETDLISMRVLEYTLTLAREVRKGQVNMSQLPDHMTTLIRKIEKSARSVKPGSEKELVMQYVTNPCRETFEAALNALIVKTL